MAEPLIQDVSEFGATQAKLAGVKLPPVLFDQSDVAYVYSLYWLKSPLDKHFQFGPFKIPGCPRNPKELRPVRVPVYGTIVGKDKGDDDVEPMHVSAKEWAKTIIHGHERFGVFVAEGDEPTREELQAALAQLESFYRSRLEQAEDVWARTGSRKGIQWVDQLAAQFFGIEKEWSHDRGQDKTCPACNKAIGGETIKCPHCTAVINWDKAREFGMLTEFQEANAIALGKLKPLLARKAEPRA